MSATLGRAGSVLLRLPRQAGSVLSAHTWADAAGLLENNDVRTVKQGQEPRFPSILLRAPGGKTFRLTVTDAGALTTTEIVRT